VLQLWLLLLSLKSSSARSQTLNINFDPRKPNIIEIGEFVLWACPKRMKKLRHQWIGLFVLLRWFLHGCMKLNILCLEFEVTTTLKDHLTFNEGEYEVDHISHIWMDSDGIYAKVHWVGFDDEEASYEDLLKLYPSCSRTCLIALRDSAIGSSNVRKHALLQLNMLGLK
jgi:hypothetical protein